jgi:uncharacterized protein YyaL (SSP411 family)
MTVFLDSDAVPFFGGTYFPPDEGRGMPSFRMVMEAVVASYGGKRDQIRDRADQMRAHLGAVGAIEPAAQGPGESLLAEAVERLRGAADEERGGFGGAPKFPPASALELLLARGETKIVERTLDAMANGGIYDQLGGGFSRDSVDAAWLVPHFEKMLYDNALLAGAYLHGFQALGHRRYERVCVETLDWMLAEMRGPEGAFYSALDADSEGEEGRFYVWTPAEVRAAVAAAGLPSGDAEAAIEHFGITEAGNFEGANVLHLPTPARRFSRGDDEKSAALEEVRAALLAAREARVRPGLDDKRIASWNALAIAALAEAGAVLRREDYLEAARGCAEFVWVGMRDEDGRLLRTYNEGSARLNAYLEDHAFLLEALLTLYEASFERIWFERAEELAATMVERFGDPVRGGFFSTSSDHEQLIARRKEIGDHPIPSGNSAAALGLLRLAALTGEQRHAREAERVFLLFGETAGRHPDAFSHLLRALDFGRAAVSQVALVGPDLDELADVVRGAHRPHLVLAGGEEGESVPPLLADRPAVDGQPTAYVCEGFVCRTPVTTGTQLSAEL